MAGTRVANVADMSLFVQLGERLTDHGGEPLTPDLMRVVGEATTDTVSVMLQGATEPVSAHLADYASGLASRGRSSLATGGRSAPALAALVNSTAAHAQDFDDATTVGVGGHISAVVIPAALAVAEHELKSGADFIDAVAHGYEVECVVADQVNPYHYEHGYHPTGTLGVFGACAAATRMLELTAHECATALAISASFSSGLKANFGTMTKPLHCGWAAHAGVTAAYLAQKGVTANVGAFDDPQGFLAVYGPGVRKTSIAAPPFGKPWRILRPGVTLRKYWPCCGSVHTAIEAGVNLHRDHGDFTDSVRQIRCYMHPRRLPHIDRVDVRSGQEARFSLQYCLALAIKKGEVREFNFSNEAVRDSAVRFLMNRIQLLPCNTEAAKTEMNGDDFAADITVELLNGKSYSSSVAHPKGSPNNPMSREDLVAKASECLSRVTGDEASALTRVDDLLAVGRRPDMQRLLATGTDGSPGAIE